MTIRRLSLCVVLLALFLLVMAGPTPGLTREGFTISVAAPVTRSFPPIAGAYPFNDARNPTVCSQAAHCDIVPIVIEPPQNLKPEEDFLVRLQLRWDDRKVEGTSTNDMHLRLYTPLDATIATSDCCVPEEILLLNATARNYKLQVSNNSGVNTGYTLFGDIRISRVTPVFELEEDTSFGGDSSGATQPVDLSDVPEETAPEPGVESAQPIPLAFIEPDRTFDSLSGSGGLGQLLQAPSVLTLGEESVPPPGPVSRTQILLWGGVLPLVILAAAYLLMKTRSMARLELET